ncbi:MAG: flagellar hook protein FlgE [Terriglobia bacterium]
MGSFSTSLSGLTAAEDALNVISNNLANLNTTGYKDMTPDFSSLFYQSLGNSGSGDPIQVGDGATIGSVSANFTQGSTDSTGIDTNMAIQGNGFFVVQNDGMQEYTRAGNFTTDTAGFLVDTNGNYVMGYPATNGTISSSQALAPLQISNGQLSPPQATTEVNLDMNLDAAASISATGALTISAQPTAGDTVTVGGTTYTFVSSLTSTANQVLMGSSDAATLANLAGAINAETGNGQAAGTTYSQGTVANTSATVTGTTANTLSLQATADDATGNSVVTTNSNAASLSFAGATLSGGVTGDSAGSFSEPMEVYDSLGASHTLSFNFTKEGTNQWGYQITIPAADVGSSGAPVVIGSGTLQFDSSGNLISPAGNVAAITVPNLADGASSMNFSWQLFNSQGSPNVTQAGAASAASNTSQSGFSSGTLTSFSITSDGTIQGAYSNGQTTVLGEVALANFANPQGLTDTSGNDYLVTAASGAAITGTAGAGGLGTIQGGAVEESNVDIATEFANLITAERDYQANAKAITTADDITQTAINLQTS